MEPILVELGPGGETIEDDPHEGEEFGYVLSGTLKHRAGRPRASRPSSATRAFISSPTAPHKLVNAGKTPCRVLWVSTPPFILKHYRGMSAMVRGYASDRAQGHFQELRRNARCFTISIFTFANANLSRCWARPAAERPRMLRIIGGFETPDTRAVCICSRAKDITRRAAL